MKIYDKPLTGQFENDIAMVDDVLRPQASFDMIKKEMLIADAKVVMYYIDGFVKGETLQKLLTYMVSVKEFGKNQPGDAKKFADMHVTSAEVDVTDSLDTVVLMVMSGCTAFFCDRFDSNALIIDLRTYPARTTEEPENDKVMRGSRDGFVETLIHNTAMIRRRIRNPDLTVQVAGGLFIQLLPFCPDEVIERLEKNLAALPSMTQMPPSLTRSTMPT